jgi:hypothetical protein
LSIYPSFPNPDIAGFETVNTSRNTASSAILLLTVIDEGKNGENTIKINRDHKAYKIWSKTELGEKYYTVMMYALTEATKNMSNNERAKFLNEFSEYLGKKSSELLG